MTLTQEFLAYGVLSILTLVTVYCTVNFNHARRAIRRKLLLRRDLAGCRRRSARRSEDAV